MNPNFWQGKRVVLTGHTGFKGSWLSLWLQSLGADLVGYSLAPPTEPALFKLAAVAAGMTSVTGDVRDGDHLQRVIAQYQPEIVLHMAAQAIVRESYTHPVETYATNVMGTVHLLEAVRQVGGVRAVVCITSDKCYENREWFWGYREHEAMGGYDPYSSSKGCAELVAKAYRNSFFSKHNNGDCEAAIGTARAGNVIGGGDWAKDRLVPDILRSLTKGETITIRNPRAVRPWQHVLEPLHGYLTLAEHLYTDASSFTDAWNFGPFESDVKPVSWLVDQLLSLWGSNISWKQDKTSQPHEDLYLKLECSKARTKLKWEPKLDLGTTLNWIVEWMKSFQAGADMRSMTEAQISRFMELIQTGGVLRVLNEESTVCNRAPLALDRQTTTYDGQAPLLDLAPDSTMVRSLDGKITFWNRSAEEMYGWTKDEAIGQVSHLLLQTQFPKPLEEIEAELVHGGRWKGGLVHSTREGKRIKVSSYWALQRDAQLKPSVVLETNRASD